MDGLILLSLLTVLAIPVSVIVLFVQVSRLKSRLARLEAALALQAQPAPAVAPEAEAAPAAVAAAAADDTITAVGPWVRAQAITPAEPPGMLTAADQNRPLVIRVDRLQALVGWLRGNLVYAVSAASLALAGIFLVQYGVERGLLPPGLRVMAALVLGAALIAVGEWLRRRHGDEGLGSTAFLPSVFSGAGIVTLFAAIVAARQLYGLIGPETALAGLSATAALAVVIGWFSGPLLVAVGLIGATAAPFIVGGSSDRLDWFFAHFALIAAVGLAVDAVRRWAWVSVLALVLGYAGGFIIQTGAGSDVGWIAQLLVLVLLAATVPELRLIPAQGGPATLPALVMNGRSGWPPFPVRLVAGSVLVSTIGLFFLVGRTSETAMLALAAMTGLALALLLWAEKAEGLEDLALLPSLGFLAALVVQGANPGTLLRDFSAQAIALRLPETSPSLVASLLLVMATLMSAAYAYRALRPGPWGVPYALPAVLTAPMAALVLEVLWQPALVLGPYLWALHVIALAAMMVALALRFARADAPDMRRAAYATLSALSLIALALFLLTTKTALTLALAVLVATAAALDRRFRLPEMSLFLQAGAAVLGYRLLVDPGLFWALDADLAPVLLAFTGTIAAMLAALWLMNPLNRPMAKAVAESAAAGLTAILANVLITRWLDSSNNALEAHWAITLNALPWLILMLAQLYRARLGGPLAWLRRLLAGLGGALAALGLAAAATGANPLFSYGPEQSGAWVRGPLILDTLLLAYALPGLILLLAAWKLPGLSGRLKLGFITVGAALVALYTGLEIRRFWQGDWLGGPSVTQGELYSYTLAMMLLGAGLFYQAIAKRSDILRHLATTVIGLTVAKVFFFDAAGLTGLTRVVSFAGLGLSLAGLAWLNRWAGSRGKGQAKGHKA